jgi:hypothetical protein
MNEMGKKIFVSWPGYSLTDHETGKRLIDSGYQVILCRKLGQRSPRELQEILDGSAGAIVSTDPLR